MSTSVESWVQQYWERDVLPTLQDYVRIPNVSAAYDADWKAHGHMDRAVELIRQWCAARPLPGLVVEVHELEGRSPVLYLELPATGPGADDTVLLYGHLDKQPEMTGWTTGPWEPVLEGDRLFGRGCADDGYAVFASLGALQLLHETSRDHTRAVVIIEASEESGSPDLPAHVEALAPRIGTPSLVICLDSGALDYDRLWVTTSLRGLAGCTVRVDVLTEGVHSGIASGVVPSSFRILRQLLDRVEDPATGRILLPELHAAIPDARVAAARATAATMPHPFAADLPMIARPMVDDPARQLIAHTWEPTLSVTGADGWPPTDRAGNVLRPFTALTLSFRLPPTVDAASAQAAIEKALSSDTPYGARVTLSGAECASGWCAPELPPWLTTALDDASNAAWGQGMRTFGEGGTIPFMGMLGDSFPAAQFVVSGVLGPGSNAHGPNEFLHIPSARRLTQAIADVLAAHANRPI
ncbi:MAG TPA: M20/M25/M40 family metallo-hydrolase [Mycobacteriales bacterium]|nr:M20/M25/M40 family metallo-hydrolase [Mycobacteriales bacterium]